MICERCKKEFNELEKFFFPCSDEPSYYCSSCYDFVLNLLAEWNAPPMSYYDEQW